jgi:hypothetical protein
MQRGQWFYYRCPSMGLYSSAYDPTGCFIIAALAWAYIVAPMIRQDWISIDDPIPITIIFTVISLLRGYFWRRFFNARLHILITNFVRNTKYGRALTS